MSKKIKIEITEETAFDAVFSPAEAVLVKMRADLLNAIRFYVKEHDLTQKDLGKLLDISQPRVSDLLSGKLSKFSLDSLVAFAATLGLGVTLVVEQVA